MAVLRLSVCLNRVPGWVYDSQGNLTNNLKRQYTYDAAGQTIVISSSGGSFSQSFDGVGNRIKTTEFGIPTYYLWSTVLGQVVAELVSTGGRGRSFVYAGEKILAEGGLIVHGEISGTSVRRTHSQSGYTILFDELDPMGADAYTEDPYIQDPNFSGRGEGGPVYPGYGNISDPSRGCTSNGIYGVCDQQPDVWFWGSDIATLPGFGTNFGSFSLAERKYEMDLAYTIAAVRALERLREGGAGRALAAAINDPQNPTPPADFRRDTFNKFQADINRCIGEIFGEKAKKIPNQTLDNAPNLDVSVNGRDLAKRSAEAGNYRSILALPDPNKGKHGTVYIQSGAWNYPNYPLDVLQGAYIHEYGNILSYKYGGGNFNKFGDKAGIGTNYKDKDTGANFQRCVFPSSIKW